MRDSRRVTGVGVWERGRDVASGMRAGGQKLEPKGDLRSRDLGEALGMVVWGRVLRGRPWDRGLRVPVGATPPQGVGFCMGHP